MSGPAFGMPVQSDGAHHSEAETARLTSAIRESLSEKSQREGYEGRRDHGPLKDVIAHQDSLYKYISWEDPVRTLGLYLGLLSLLFGVHYLPLTQFALKAGATTLGVISAMEFAGRVFGPNTFLARLRPKEYKTIPESTLNATLKDIHDFIQWATVRVQRIIFGQDLDNTFAAFLGCTTLFWLIKVVSPFGVAMLCLTSIFTASLVISPRGRETALDAKARTQELASAAADKGAALAQDGKDTAAQLPARARDSGIYMSQGIEDMTQGGKETVANLSTQASNTASNAMEAVGLGANKSSQPSKDTTKPMGQDDNIPKNVDYPKPAFEHLENTAYARPPQTAGQQTGTY